MTSLPGRRRGRVSSLFSKYARARGVAVIGMAGEAGSQAGRRGGGAWLWYSRHAQA